MNQPTQADVAQSAGVSRATVSYVLNGKVNRRSPISEETRQRVLDAIEELGYEPDARAQALRSGSTNTIALMIPDLRNPHFGEYATGVEEAARESGYHLLLSSTNLSDDYAVDVFKDLARRRFDGLIIIGSFIVKSAEAQTILARIRKRNLPIVEMNEYYGYESIQFTMEHGVCGCSSHHHPASHPVHVLPKTNRFRNDIRRSEGIIL